MEVSLAAPDTILPLLGLLFFLLCCVKALCIGQVINSNGQEDVQQDVWSSHLRRKHWPTKSVKTPHASIEMWVSVSSRVTSMWAPVGYSFHRWREWWSKCTPPFQRRPDHHTPLYHHTSLYSSLLLSRSGNTTQYRTISIIYPMTDLNKSPTITIHNVRCQMHERWM